MTNKARKTNHGIALRKGAYRLVATCKKAGYDWLFSPANYTQALVAAATFSDYPYNMLPTKDACRNLDFPTSHLIRKAWFLYHGGAASI